MYLLALLVHDSMENRLRFVFKLVDFTSNGALNMAEMILLFGSALRGIARMKGIEDAEYWHSEKLARDVFRKSNVHFRAGEGVGDYAAGGITIKMLVDWARDDSDARSLLDNVDFGAYLSSLLMKQQTLWKDLIDIRAAMQLKKTKKDIHDTHQEKVRLVVQQLRTTDPGKFQTPKMISDVTTKNNERKKKITNGTLVINDTKSDRKNKLEQRVPLWDTGDHTLMEKERALVIARRIYAIYGVMSLPNKRERKNNEYYEKKIIREHNEKKMDVDDVDDGDNGHYHQQLVNVLISVMVVKILMTV